MGGLSQPPCLPISTSKQARSPPSCPLEPARRMPSTSVPGGSSTHLLATAGSTAIPVTSAIAEVAQALERELALKRSTALLENPMATSSDPWLQQAQSRIGRFGEEVYHLLFHDDDRGRILASLREAKGYPA